jgi:WD40 repeat protein
MYIYFSCSRLCRDVFQLRLAGLFLVLPFSLDACTVRCQELATLKAGSEVSKVAVSPNGKILASAAKDRYVTLWEVRSGKIHGILLGHKDYVQCVTFSPDGKMLASGSGDGQVRLWSIESGKETDMITAQTRWHNALAFSPDGKTLAFQNGNKVELWDLDS